MTVFDEKFKNILVEDDFLYGIFTKIAIHILAEDRIKIATKKTIIEMISEAEEIMTNHGIICTKDEIFDAITTWIERAFPTKAEREKRKMTEKKHGKI